jgi:hypothetical protein
METFKFTQNCFCNSHQQLLKATVDGQLFELSIRKLADGLLAMHPPGL